ncbi:ABC transporter ATP-binding protein [Naasia sp. SYSU D00948]|uniref:ABC transporter ATP-binding protein n=1 Tax=Naasia sp. SYSU D00948 TaxID=2817379 RepID=UPI0027DCCA8A|nr:ABC transporter ATP-binding protein [Naasia sp. SYSU D00948]
MASGIRAARLEARSWGWRHASRRDWAVRGLDLDVPAGQRVLLLGASGAGKSTLLLGAAGLLGGVDEGEEAGAVLLDGVPSASARGRAGLVQQDPEAGVILARVGDDVAFGCENLGVPRGEIWARVAEALDAVGLDVPLDTPTSRLSGGQKQRLAMAGVLAMRPGLVLLDEPTANLDPEGVAEVRAAVARLVEETGATLVVVEHRTDVWADLVDRVVVLGPDGVVADGAPAGVFGQEGDRLAAGGVWVPGHLPQVAPAEAREGEPLLRIERLTAGRGRRPVLTLDEELEVAGGTATAFTGPNGAGKSTVALTLAGLLPPLAGRVDALPALAAGAAPEPARWRSRELLSRIGTVFQNPEHQFLTGRVADELAVGPRALGLPEDAVAARVEELLERLGLSRLAAANPFTLSGGEKRRLSVATALATRPRMLVLDEPTFGQDVRTWTSLVLLFRELLDEGAALVTVTHDDRFLSALATRTVALGAVGAGSRA